MPVDELLSWNVDEKRESHVSLEHVSIQKMTVHHNIIVRYDTHVFALIAELTACISRRVFFSIVPRDGLRIKAVLVAFMLIGVFVAFELGNGKPG